MCLQQETVAEAGCAANDTECFTKNKYFNTCEYSAADAVMSYFCIHAFLPEGLLAAEAYLAQGHIVTSVDPRLTDLHRPLSLQKNIKQYIL